MKILVAVRELGCGGTEIALLNFLRKISSSRNEITLLLARKRGENLINIPDNVEIVEIPFKNEIQRYYISDDVTLVNNRIQKNVIKCCRKIIRGADKTIKKINYKADLYNSYILTKTIPLTDLYDIAIDFYGYGIFQSKYIARNVNASRKIMWIHDEKLDPISRARCEFGYYDYFFGVSQACVNAFIKAFPETKERVGVFYNILDSESIIRKSDEKMKDQEFEDTYTIVSVGRLERQKGFDLAIDAAYRLKQAGLSFKWLIIGEGSWQERLYKQIQRLGVSDCVKLMGKRKNPYPYIKNCDLYVQTSRHEGYGLTIAEARILEKPIISTKLSCVEEQIIDGVTGKLVPFDAEMLAKAITSMMKCPEMAFLFKENLKKYNKKMDYDVLQVEEMLKGYHE